MVLRGVEEEVVGSSILGRKGASKLVRLEENSWVCGGSGGAVRILRLRGNMDGAGKLLRAWKLCSEPESNGGTPEVERLVGADELVWVAA